MADSGGVDMVSFLRRALGCFPLWPVSLKPEVESLTTQQGATMMSRSDPALWLPGEESIVPVRNSLVPAFPFTGEACFQPGLTL